MKRLFSLAFVMACSSPAAKERAPTVIPVPVVSPEVTADPPPPAPLTLEDPTGQMAPFYQSLASGGRIVIDEFGDSHTAGDRLTGRLRSVLQGKYGDAGRGFVLPGRPRIKWYELTDVRYATEGDWRADQGGKHGTKEPYGLAGVRSYADRKSAEVWIETCPDCTSGHAVGSFEIYYLRQKGGGVLEAKVDDGDWQRIHTGLGKDEGEDPIPDYLTIPVTDGEHKLTLRPHGDSEVDVFGIAMERAQPGVVVDALGIVGLQMSHLWSWDWNVIGPQLAHRGPSLVILQYGTNEVDDPDLDLDRFERRYVELLGRVKEAVPGAAVLVLGPPDLGKRELSKKECDKLARSIERRNRRRSHGHRHDPPELMPETCSFTTPQKLLDVIDAERKAANEAGVAFFDSFTAMGGAGVMETMIAADPPLAYGDHTHFTGKGYAVWGDLLLDDLMRGYASWEKRTTSAR